MVAGKTAPAGSIINRISKAANKNGTNHCSPSELSVAAALAPDPCRKSRNRVGTRWNMDRNRLACRRVSLNSTVLETSNSNSPSAPVRLTLTGPRFIHRHPSGITNTGIRVTERAPLWYHSFRNTIKRKRLNLNNRSQANLELSSHRRRRRLFARYQPWLCIVRSYSNWAELSLAPKCQLRPRPL